MPLRDILPSLLRHIAITSVYAFMLFYDIIAATHYAIDATLIRHCCRYAPLPCRRCHYTLIQYLRLEAAELCYHATAAYSYAATGGMPYAATDAIAAYRLSRRFLPPPPRCHISPLHTSRLLLSFDTLLDTVAGFRQLYTTRRQRHI